LESDSQSEDAMPASQALAYVVDDEEVIATTLALILSRSGFDAKAFTEPLEALRAAELRCPDFLITDVAMPVMNGIDLAIQFKAIFPRCRVLLFSGALSTAARIDGAREKGVEFSILAKPVHPNELLATLKKMRE
jgi:DNA-binding response OmpR family regulator